MLKIKTSEVEILCGLDQLPETFHLTGSRFFDSWVKDTDTDLFTTYTHSLGLHLQHMGFRDITGGYYEGCCQVVQVFRNGKIDVQLVQDAELKCRIQEILSEVYGASFNRLTKDLRKNIWQAMYAAYEAGVTHTPRNRSNVHMPDKLPF